MSIVNRKKLWKISIGLIIVATLSLILFSGLLTWTGQLSHDQLYIDQDVHNCLESYSKHYNIYWRNIIYDNHSDIYNGGSHAIYNGINSTELNNFWTKYLTNHEVINLGYVKITFICGIVGSAVSLLPGIFGMLAYYGASPNTYLGWHVILCYVGFAANCGVIGQSGEFLSTVLNYQKYDAVWGQPTQRSPLVLSSVYYYVTIMGLSKCSDGNTATIFPLQLGLIISSMGLMIMLLSVYGYSICLHSVNQSVIWDLFFDRWGYQPMVIDRDIFRRKKERKISYVLFAICSFTTILSVVSPIIRDTKSVCTTYGTPAGGVFTGFPAAIFILFAANADYPEFHMKLHFIMCICTVIVNVVLLSITGLYVYVVKLKPNLLSSVLVHHGGLCMVEGVHAALEYTAAVGGIDAKDYMSSVTLIYFVALTAMCIYSAVEYRKCLVPKYAPLQEESNVEESNE